MQAWSLGSDGGPSPSDFGGHIPEGLWPVQTPRQLMPSSPVPSAWCPGTVLCKDTWRSWVLEEDRGGPSLGVPPEPPRTGRPVTSSEAQTQARQHHHHRGFLDLRLEMGTLPGHSRTGNLESNAGRPLLLQARHRGWAWTLSLQALGKGGVIRGALGSGRPPIPPRGCLTTWSPQAVFPSIRRAASRPGF